MTNIVSKFSAAAADVGEGLKSNLGSSLLPANKEQKDLRVDAGFLAFGCVLALSTAPLVGGLLIALSAGQIAYNSFSTGRAIRHQKNKEAQGPQL